MPILAGAVLPTVATCGDFFDFITIGDGVLCLVVAAAEVPERHLQPLGEGAAAQVLDDHVVVPPVLKHSLDARDVGVLQPRGRARLAQEPLSRVLVPPRLLKQRLHRHLTVELGVVGSPHLPHATLSEALSNLVAIVDDGSLTDRSWRRV